MAHPIPERPKESLNGSEGLGRAYEGGASPLLHPSTHWPASLAGNMDSGSQLEPHEQKCSFGFPVGIPRAGMFSWFSCWNPWGRNVLVGFLLEFHEKHFHSSSLMPLFQGHGVLRDSQALSLPGSARGLWGANECGNLLAEGLLGHRQCCCCNF